MKAGPKLNEHADEVIRVNPASIKDPFCKLSILSPIVRINEGTSSFFIKSVVRTGSASIVGVLRGSVSVVVEEFVGGVGFVGGVEEFVVGFVGGVVEFVGGVGVGGNTSTV